MAETIDLAARTKARIPASNRSLEKARGGAARFWSGWFRSQYALYSDTSVTITSDSVRRKTSFRKRDAFTSSSFAFSVKRSMPSTLSMATLSSQLGRIDGCKLECIPVMQMAISRHIIRFPTELLRHVSTTAGHPLLPGLQHFVIRCSMQAVSFGSLDARCFSWCKVDRSRLPSGEEGRYSDGSMLRFSSSERTASHSACADVHTLTR